MQKQEELWVRKVGVNRASWVEQLDLKWNVKEISAAI